VSKLLFIIIKFSHGYVVFSWRSQRSVALLLHDLGPKGFHSGREKPGLKALPEH
jgi:hypothetical protein